LRLKILTAKFAEQTIVLTKCRLCKNVFVTNLRSEHRLIEEARRLGGHKTKKEAVSAALAKYVKRRKQLGILDLFGTLNFDPKYNYKVERQRKRC
jgi:hypothetical protein